MSDPHLSTADSDVTRNDAGSLSDAAEAAARSRGFATARAYLRDTDERTISEQVELTEIEAPPFAEHVRGVRMAELMASSGLERISTDEIGNVLGWLPEGGAPAGAAAEASTSAPPFIVSAHLDTVFPAGTDVRVRREGSRLFGPGIGDDGRGLAALLAMARSMIAASVTPGWPVLFVATVGEEGTGNLRGVRHLFGPLGAGSQASGFISLDGAGHERIVNAGVGSRRYRVTVSGPGGHSWVDYGLANPIHAVGNAITSVGRIPLESESTMTVGRISGGTSVNAIPENVWLEMEVRSTSDEHLVGLDQELRERLALAVADENSRRKAGSPNLELTIEDLGSRPGGSTPADRALVRAAVAATEALGYTPELVPSSTDANVSMSLGIPSVTLGAGGNMGRAHTLDEWYDNTGGILGIERALLTLMTLDSLG
jgi:tripeptide aminopeptidase